MALFLSICPGKMGNQRLFSFFLLLLIIQEGRYVGQNILLIYTWETMLEVTRSIVGMKPFRWPLLLFCEAAVSVAVHEGKYRSKTALFRHFKRLGC